MDYGKLKLSFVLLIVMCLIQLLTGLFIIQSTLISILSVIALILCIGSLWYMSTKTK